MSTLLEKALEKVSTLPPEEQEAIASQILASLADEEAWKRRFAEKRDIIRRMAREAIEEDERSEAQRSLKEAATRLDTLLAAKGLDEDEIVADFELWRAAKCR